MTIPVFIGLEAIKTETVTGLSLYGLSSNHILSLCFSSLVPPSCSTGEVSDWFNQLTAVNQEIGNNLQISVCVFVWLDSFLFAFSICTYKNLKTHDSFTTWLQSHRVCVCVFVILCVWSDSLHADFLNQLRCCYEQTWQDRLAEVERCEVKTHTGQVQIQIYYMFHHIYCPFNVWLPLSLLTILYNFFYIIKPSALFFVLPTLLTSCVTPSELFILISYFIFNFSCFWFYVFCVLLLFNK